MLAAVRAHQTGSLPWGSLPGGAGGVGAAGIPGSNVTHAPGQPPHGSSPPVPAHDKLGTRAQLAAMAAGLAAQTGVLATVSRYVGSQLSNQGSRSQTKRKKGN
jgi:hypothetical protein